MGNVLNADGDGEGIVVVAVFIGFPIIENASQ